MMTTNFKYAKKPVLFSMNPLKLSQCEWLQFASVLVSSRVNKSRPVDFYALYPALEGAGAPKKFRSETGSSKKMSPGSGSATQKLNS
jgi:hypothetical protein